MEDNFQLTLKYLPTLPHINPNYTFSKQLIKESKRQLRFARKIVSEPANLFQADEENDSTLIYEGGQTKSLSPFNKFYNLRILCNHLKALQSIKQIQSGLIKITRKVKRSCSPKQIYYEGKHWQLLIDPRFHPSHAFFSTKSDVQYLFGRYRTLQGFHYHCPYDNQTFEDRLFPLKNPSNLTHFTWISEKGDQEDKLHQFQFATSILQNAHNIQSLTLNFTYSNGYIDDSELQKLSSVFQFMSQLRRLNLNLGGNQISYTGVQSLSQDIQYLHKLQDLKLAFWGNEIYEIDESSKDQVHKAEQANILQYIEPMMDLHTLELNFSQNIITDSIVLELGQYLLNVPNLQNLKLQLWRNKISDLGLQYICAGLENLQKLSSLKIYLANNKITNQGAKTVSKAVEQLSQLNSLIINMSNTRIRSEGLRSITTSIGKLEQLRCIGLQFEGSHITDSDLNSVVEMCNNLQHRRILEVFLYFGENDITNHGFMDLMNGISCLKEVELLDLGFKKCKIQDTGFLSLVKTLENFKELSVLRIDMEKSHISGRVLDKFEKTVLHLRFLNVLNLFLKGNNIEKDLVWEMKQRLAEEIDDVRVTV